MTEPKQHPPKDLWNNSQLIRQNPSQSQYQEHSEALFLTSSFKFDSAEKAADLFAQTHGEYIYSRFCNPTIATLNQRLAIIENAPSALATASGMAAVLTIVMSLCQSNDRILCAANVFGSTIQLLSNHLSRFGIVVDYITSNHPDDWHRQAKKGNTRLLFLETPSNPMHHIFDLTALAQVATDNNAYLIVDNCFCAGLQQPLNYGAHVVVHSVTKYLDGQGRALGGAVVGKEDIIMEKCYPFLRCAGPALSPFNAWLFVKSLETLDLRVNRHCDSALIIAKWLEQQAVINQVWYSALPSHPDHQLAMRQQNGRGGGIITINVGNCRQHAWQFINALNQFSITANFGDAKSTVVHPATTTHHKLNEEQRFKIGLNDCIVRFSIGLENPQILMEDIDQALKKIQ